MVRRPFTLSSLLLVALAACAGSDEPPPASWRPALERTAPLPPEDVVVDERSDFQEWQSDAPDQRVLEQNGVRALALRGAEEVEVAIPGTYRAGDFDLVRLEVLCNSPMTLRVGLRSEEGATGSLDVAHAGEQTAATHAFDLRDCADEGRVFDELVVLGKRTHRNEEELDWSLLGVTLLRRAPERWLPLAGEAPALIDVAGECRRGVGLAPGSPLLARIRVPESGGRLQLGIAPAPRTAGARNFSVDVAGAPRIDAEVGDGWESHALDLGPWAGEEVQVRFASRGALVALEQPTVVAGRDPAPTVLLISSDTHRGAYVGAARAGVEVLTPNLDALAARGVLFEDCFASSDITLPSHCALMTGLDPAVTGVTTNRTRLADSAVTLAERFSEAGYTTFAVTSAKHMHHEWSGLGQGFERLQYPTTGREQPARETLDVALEWLPDAEGAPLFLFVHVFDVHRPYDPPEEDARRYYGDGDPYDRTLPEPTWPTQGHLRGVRDRAWVEALYRGQVTALDRDLARLLDLPRVRRGVIALTSDHGESLGEQGIFWQHKGVYPAVLRVPLVLAWPDAPAGVRVAAPVRLGDVAHTLLSLAGLDGSGVGGVDLAPHWTGEAPAELPRFALASEGHAAAVTLGRWHLVVNLSILEDVAYTRDLAAEQPVALFDLAEDEYAERDLSQAEPETVARLGKALLRWLEAAPAAHSAHNQLDEESAAMLSALGYAAASGEGSAVIDLDAVRARLAPWVGD